MSLICLRVALMHDTWRIWRLYVGLLLGIMAGSVCTPLPSSRLPPPSPVIRVPGIDSASWKAGGIFVAGIGKVDITPPPGLPLFGYSRARTANAAGGGTRVFGASFL